MDERYGLGIRLFKALCDENRLAILDILRTGERCACVILDKLDIAQSTLSHHLKILCESGLVACRQEGKWSHYSLAREGRDNALALLDEFTSVTAQGKTKER